MVRSGTAKKIFRLLAVLLTAVLALVREEKLRVLSDEEGRFYGIGAWSDCVSACKI